MSPLCFILASAALVCAAPEGRDTGHGCAVAAACLEKCASDPGGEACARPCHGPPLRPRATKASPADLRVAYFLHHRKAAGTSMLAALKRVAGRVGVEGGSLLVAHEEFRPFNPNLFCSASGASAGVLYVTVLRHPLHRLVSLYHYESNFGDRDPAANRNASAWGAFLDGACARHSGHRPCGNRRIDLHAIDATPARWRGDVGSSPIDKNYRVHPTHWLIPTGHRCAAPNYYARRLLGFARVTKAPADCLPRGRGRASVECDVAAPGTCAEPTFHPRWLDQAAARQIHCCNAFAAGETRRGHIGFAFGCDCGQGARRLLRDLTSDVGIAVSSSEVGFQVAKRVLEGFDFAVALERMDERAARKLSGLLGTTVSFPHHRARAGASGGFNRRAAAVPTSIRDRILREHDVDVRLHAWLAARDP